MESSPDNPVLYEVLRPRTKSDSVDYESVVVVESDAGVGQYCLVPPLGRNPFAAGSLEKNTNVHLYPTITDLARAIRELPPSVEVQVGDPTESQPSKYKLRAMTRKEFSQAIALIGEETR
ncbi:MAG: hypothetical protein ACYC0Y_27320 [Pirellulales bacterium]